MPIVYDAPPLAATTDTQSNPPNQKADGVGFFRRRFTIRLDSWVYRCNPPGRMRLRVSGSMWRKPVRDGFRWALLAHF